MILKKNLNVVSLVSMAWLAHYPPEQGKASGIVLLRIEIILR